MDQRTEPIRQDIDAIRDSMTDKMEQIESKIKGTVEDTRRMVDVKYQVSQRPWAALGASILFGYALGSIGGDDTPSARHRSEPSEPSETIRYYSATSEDRSRSTHDRTANFRSQPAIHHDDSRSASKPIFMDQIMEQFGDEIQLLKAAALTSVTGLIRDTVRRNLPALNDEVERMRGQHGISNTSAAPRSYGQPRATSGDASSYYNTADAPLHERSVGEVSTQADVGRSPNYDFIPPAPHAEPGGRP
jgi:hypothetical protein